MLKFMSMMLAGAALLAAEQGGCSNASLKGTYGFLVNGTRPSGPPPAPLEQMVGISVAYFDGQGHRTGSDNIHGSINGLVPDQPVTGIYTVNEDCSGSMTMLPSAPGAPTLEIRFVLLHKGKEIFIAVMSPATVMVTSTGKRI